MAALEFVLLEPAERLPPVRLVQLLAELSLANLHAEQLNAGIVPYLVDAA